MDPTHQAGQHQVTNQAGQPKVEVRVQVDQFTARRPAGRAPLCATETHPVRSNQHQSVVLKERCPRGRPV